jgi:Uncharacterised nucleotidyltransferase
MTTPSPQLQALASALRPALGLAGGGKVMRQMSVFAEKRHRVAPLLHHAMARGGSTSDGEAAETLARLARANAQRVLRQKAATLRLATLFAAEGIVHAEVKGYRLGELLYGGETLRHSKDVDVLLNPAQMDAGIACVAANGYTAAGGGPLDPQHLCAILRWHREVEIHDPRTGVAIELHARLLSTAPAAWDDSKVLHGPRDLTSSEYVLYLILHGAASHWHRLKWLADLAMIARRTDPAVRGEVIALAREYTCLPALVASFRTCGTLWGGEVVAEWLDCIGPIPHHRFVRLHEEAFVRALHREGSRPQRQSLLRRFAILRDPPLFGEHFPSRRQLLKTRIAFWYLQKFR